MLSTLSQDSSLATILGFLILATGAILGPFLGSKRTIAKINKPNGATKKSSINPEDYKDYNIADLVLQSLINSEDAKVEARKATIGVKENSRNITKIMEHLGIKDM